MKNFYVRTSALVVATFLTNVCLGVGAAEVGAEAPNGGIQLGRLLRDSNADLPVYSCDLRKQFSQCRQYAVFPGNAAVRVTELTQACHSLGGDLLLTPCPATQVLAQCHEVKFRRDVVYNAVYYTGQPANWTMEGLKEVCKHLPGQFVEPQK